MPFEHNPFFLVLLTKHMHLKRKFCFKGERLLAREEKFSDHRESEKDCVDTGAGDGLLVDIVVVIVLVSPSVKENLLSQGIYTPG